MSNWSWMVLAAPSVMTKRAAPGRDSISMSRDFTRAGLNWGKSVADSHTLPICCRASKNATVILFGLTCRSLGGTRLRDQSRPLRLHGFRELRICAPIHRQANQFLAGARNADRRARHGGPSLSVGAGTGHKDSEVWSWFKSNRHWLEVHQLPPYSPELNPTERLWQYTRKNGTHDRYFASQGELVATLTRVFADMQSYPELIRPRLLPFC